MGCKDFTQDGSTLYEFSKMGKDMVEYDRKIGTAIENIELVINNSDWIKNKEEIINGFWDMFVIDALIGVSSRNGKYSTLREFYS